MGKKIIIDTDPGVDDTMAICMALHSPELEIVGLTTVFGNADVETTSLNGLRLVELEGNDHIPVIKGCGKSLAHAGWEAPVHVHGKDGMGNSNPPPPHGSLLHMHAARFIIETVLAHPGEITLVPVGPLTNIALALHLEPRIAQLVKEVVIMGGAAYVPGNITPMAEANIYNDPLAASLVFSAGWKLTMVGLDVTQKVMQTPAHFAELFRHPNAVTLLIQRILPCYQQYFDKFLGLNGSIYTHDPSDIACIIEPSLFKMESVPVYVETEGFCRGKTIPDSHGTLRSRFYGTDMGKKVNPVQVCTGVDSAGVLSLLRERLIH